MEQQEVTHWSLWKRERRLTWDTTFSQSELSIIGTILTIKQWRLDQSTSSKGIWNDSNDFERIRIINSGNRKIGLLIICPIAIAQHGTYYKIAGICLSVRLSSLLLFAAFFLELPGCKNHVHGSTTAAKAALILRENVIVAKHAWPAGWEWHVQVFCLVWKAVRSHDDHRKPTCHLSAWRYEQIKQPWTPEGPFHCSK